MKEKSSKDTRRGLTEMHFMFTKIELEGNKICSEYKIFLMKVEHCTGAMGDFFVKLMIAKLCKVYIVIFNTKMGRCSQKEIDLHIGTNYALYLSVG